MGRSTRADTGEHRCRAVLRALQRWRARRLYITNPHFVPKHSFVEMLAGAARRGVDVRVVAARTDVDILRSAGRTSYDALLSAGVRVYQWQPTTLYAKAFVVAGSRPPWVR